MSELVVSCPKKKCKGAVTAYVSNDEGNTEGSCDACDTRVGFHYAIEIEDIHIVEEEEE